MSSGGPYLAGQKVVCEFTFKNTAGVDIDPAAATLTIQPPNTPAVDHPLTDATHVSTGVFTLVADTTGKPGRWLYKGVGDDGVETSERIFTVLASAVT